MMIMETKFLAKKHMRLNKKKIDFEINKILSAQMQKSQELVRQKRDLIQTLSEKLLEKDILSFIEVNEILGERPFEPRENFKRFLEEILKKEPIENEEKSTHQNQEEVKIVDAISN